jgi:hypothetical protein
MNMTTQTAIDDDILNLMRFYQVDSEHQLIKAQAEHIERLQARVAKAEIMSMSNGVNVPRRG